MALWHGYLKKIVNEKLVHLVLGLQVNYQTMTYTIKLVNFLLGALFQNNLGHWWGVRALW